MKAIRVLVIVLLAATVVAACSDSGGVNVDASKSTAVVGKAEIVIHGRTHHFESVECSKGFNHSTGVVLKNNQVRVELSQLSPSDNTWDVKYFTVLENQLDDEYFSREYDLRLSGGRITGTAIIERGTLPRDPVKIGVFVECQAL